MSIPTKHFWFSAALECLLCGNSRCNCENSNKLAIHFPHCSLSAVNFAVSSWIVADETSTRSRERSPGALVCGRFNLLLNYAQNVSTNDAIGQFPSCVWSLCQNESSCETIHKKMCFARHFHFHANQTHFHLKSFSPRLVLKQMQKATKWPIITYAGLVPYMT